MSFMQPFKAQQLHCSGSNPTGKGTKDASVNNYRINNYKGVTTEAPQPHMWFVGSCTEQSPA